MKEEEKGSRSGGPARASSPNAGPKAAASAPAALALTYWRGVDPGVDVPPSAFPFHRVLCPRMSHEGRQPRGPQGSVEEPGASRPVLFTRHTPVVARERQALSWAPEPADEESGARAPGVDVGEGEEKQENGKNC